MNFGQNLYNWFLSNAQSLVLLAIVVIGLYLGFKREFSKLIGFLVVSLVAVGLVFNADGVKDILLELFNKIIGAFDLDESWRTPPIWSGFAPMWSLWATPSMRSPPRPTRALGSW